MPGTLTISTLSDGTNSTSATNPILGSARAWVKFQGGFDSTAGVINGSYNVSSVTVNGTGDYTVNFTTSFANANYGAVVSCSNNFGSVFANTSNTNPTASALNIYTISVSNQSTVNTRFVYAACFSS